ncbi:MAG: GTPase Era, partial [Chitinophagaceae bacterium]
NIFGKPNAGKSTLLNALLGEKLAITSPKVQTTRHRILGILNRAEVQIIFSDTPGIIKPEYKLHEKMMQVVKFALEDADVALFLMDATDSPEKNRELFSSLKVKSSKILVINKTDLVSREKLQEINRLFQEQKLEPIIEVSALKNENIEALIEKIITLLPQCPPYYPEDMLTEKPVRFFVGELIREKIFNLYHKEIPYHTTVLVTQFEEKNTLTKIAADIIVQRETQKGIILGEKGKAIKELGSLARLDIENFIGRKVFLELHVKVRDRWRDKDIFLKEYGYN